MFYYVTGTVRESACSKSSPITQLAIRPSINGSAIFDLVALKSLADQSLLRTICKDGLHEATVFIYRNDWGRMVASTRRDGVTCDNLLALPILYFDRANGSTSYYESCPA